VKYVKLGNEMIEVVQEFCYLGDVRSVMSYGSECWAMKKVDTRRMQAAAEGYNRSGRYRESYGRDQTEMAWSP